MILFIFSVLLILEPFLSISSAEFCGVEETLFMFMFLCKGYSAQLLIEWGKENNFALVS